MRTYLVGGAVRDALLGLPAGDRDFVVVGATQAGMQAHGFKAVGRDFPVFLHPVTGEEHALARTERKSGRGYRGFVVDADPSVTLEQDLARRDFTINAIAREVRADGTLGELVDPLGGRSDIASRVLRHAGPAFVEDPLRVLRAARFMARLAPLGFTLAPETRELMRAIAAGGELADLVPERVWQELRRALSSDAPQAFIATLREAGALVHVLPEVDALYGIPQRPEYHPEVDTGVHVEMVLAMAARLAPGDDMVGFAALAHDLGKARTPAHVLPRHIGHEHAGLAPLRVLCERLRVPREHRMLAECACREHLNVHRLAELKPATVHDLLSRCDGLRHPTRIARLATVCEADKRGRGGLSEAPYPQSGWLLEALHAMQSVRRDAVDPHLAGEALGAALRCARITAIAAAVERWQVG